MKANEALGRVVMLIGGVMALSSIQVGCLVLNEDHCLANGGDLACPGRMCLVQTGPRVETVSDDFGCSEAPFTNNPVHEHAKARFGLPAELELGQSTTPLDTVEGILLETQEDRGFVESCSLDDRGLEAELAILEMRYLVVQEIRDRLEHEAPKTGSRSIITLSQEEADAIGDYSRAVDDWLDDCKRLQNPPAPGP